MYAIASNVIEVDDFRRIYPIRDVLVTYHLLVDLKERKAILIDSGLSGRFSLLERTLFNLNLNWCDITAILLTHGHLDHTGGLAKIKALSGAAVFAHPLEQPHIDGTFNYKGPSRICGLLESVGRRLIRYEPVSIDQPLVPGSELPFWGGLTVIHLPGHTEGHCGFYSRQDDLLFSGDLFASYYFTTHLPPFYLNTCPEMIATTLKKVQMLNPKYVIPNHYHGLNGILHRKYLDKLTQRTLLNNKV